MLVLMEPGHLHIQCERCGKRAVFEQPFEFLTKQPQDELRPAHQWGGWYVVEKYAHVLPWTPPKQSHQVRWRGAMSVGVL